MPQSGMVSAIGMAIESVWRTIPFTGGSPVSMGVAGTNPARFWSVEPSGGIIGKPILEVPQTEVDGSIELTRTLLVGKQYGGDFSFKGDGENLYYPLLALFGRDIQTQVAGAASTMITPVYKHVFQYGKYAPSFSVEEDLGDATYGRLSSGAVVSGLDFSLGTHLIARMMMEAYHQIPNTYQHSGSDVDYDFGSTAAIIPDGMGGDAVKTIVRTASPTYINVEQLQKGSGPFVFGSMAYGNAAGFAANLVTIDDAGASPSVLEGFSLSLGRRIEGFMTGLSGFDKGACVGNEAPVTGRLPALLLDNTLQRAAMRHSKIGINFQLKGVYIGSSAVQYAIEFYIPAAKFIDAGTPLASGALSVPGDFVARKDPTLGYSAQVTLWNTISNAALLGTQASAPGGLGGWQAS